MPSPRPAECPACGYERPRRLPDRDRAFSLSDAPPAQRWACGLCRYEWAVTSPAAARRPLV